MCDVLRVDLYELLRAIRYRRSSRSQFAMHDLRKSLMPPTANMLVTCLREKRRHSVNYLDTLANPDASILSASSECANLLSQCWKLTEMP